jgi:hypothetical protein
MEVDTSLRANLNLGGCMTDGRKIIQLQVKKMTAGNGWEFFWLFAVCDDGTLWERMWNTDTDAEQLWSQIQGPPPVEVA